MKTMRILITWSLLGIMALFFFAFITQAVADPIRSYKEPLICKPQEVRGNVTYTSTNPSTWIILKWSDYVSLGKGKILFKYEDRIVEVPMPGYSCLPKAYEMKGPEGPKR